MGDSDDDSFVTFGNALEPLDEDNLPRKKPITIEDRYALDQQGRRRFHGAFTGGFSAGYFNSVGTRDGWRPQNFKSSRSSKAEGVFQRPEDFMDEEDTGEFGIAPTAIRASANFVDHPERGTKRERQRRDASGPIPGVPVLQNLLKPVKDTVGVALLKKMGWRPGQGVGPRVTKREKTKIRRNNEKMKIYGCSLPNERTKMEESDASSSEDEHSQILFAPDDYEPFRCNPKDNYFGIGYSGLERRPVLSDGHTNFLDVPAFKLEEKNRKLSIRGQAFGVGAFEADDQDIYERDDMTRYDFSLGPETNNKSRWSKNQSESSKENCLEGFQPAMKKLERKEMFEPPELPADAKPFHKVRKSRFYPPIERVDQRAPTLNNGDGNKSLTRQDLDSRSRAIILGESSVQNPRISSTVACNIIARSLNLDGKERVEERKLQESRRSNIAGNSWLEKLDVQSFVKGGVEGSDRGVEGSFNNLQDFKLIAAEKSRSAQLSKPFVADTDKQGKFVESTNENSSGVEEKLQAERADSQPEISENPEETWTKDKFLGSGVAESANSESKTPNDRMIDAAKMKLFGKLTRERETWRPASLLCKRFNIPEPRSGCAKPDDRCNNKRFSVFHSLEFGASSDRFESAAAPNIPTTRKDDQPPPAPFTSSSNAERASRLIDTSDIDVSSGKSSNKIRSFEASYEKIFGRGNTERSSAVGKDPDETDEREGRQISESTSCTDSVEKQDLFKAIFLSSSEDSASENDEDDSEAVKSLLIGKTPGEQLNVQRNTSPPRGIFAKLDLDRLAKPGKIEISSRELDSARGDDERANVPAEREMQEELPPNVYGPILPKIPLRNERSSSKEESASSMDFPSQRIIFKSVIVDAARVEGKWVERTKSKKSKKDKHKRKHREKERSRHKHKSKKDKR